MANNWEKEHGAPPLSSFTQSKRRKSSQIFLLFLPGNEIERCRRAGYIQIDWPKFVRSRQI